MGLTFEDLKTFLMGKEIAKFKIPERLEIMTDFPLSTFGKVSKKKLAEMVATKDGCGTKRRTAPRPDKKTPV